ncbi:MAG: hypothetical protein KDK50_04170 [Chlamydiia bacterium]|nr:hypothetical protein [Chlamydiia bacterium]
MTTYVVKIPGCDSDYFTWPSDYCAPLFSQKPLEGAQEVEVKEGVAGSDVQDGIYLIYKAWKRTYEKIWTKLGGEPSKNILTIRHEFSKWLKDREIKVMDLSGISLCAIDLDFLSSAQMLNTLILCKCHLQKKHAKQLEKIFENRSLKKLDLSLNRSLKQLPKLTNVEEYIAKDSAFSVCPKGIRVVLNDFSDSYGESEPCYVEPDSESDDKSHSNASS